MTSTWPSKSAVSKAGSRIRKWARREISTEDAQGAFAIVEQHRRRFSDPMAKVNMGLRSMLNSQKLEGTVSQRLKRFPTIIKKITDYEAGLDLARMRDIGGCRVVLDSIEGVWIAEKWITSTWDLAQDPIDYISAPRKSGYRALHLIVLRDEVPIEVQIRTQRMHNWAEVTEAFGNTFGVNLKTDACEHPSQELMQYVSILDQAEEMGNSVPRETIDEAKRLAIEVKGMLGIVD